LNRSVHLFALIVSQKDSLHSVNRPYYRAKYNMTTLEIEGYAVLVIYGLILLIFFL